MELYVLYVEGGTLKFDGNTGQIVAWGPRGEPVRNIDPSPDWRVSGYVKRLPGGVGGARWPHYELANLLDTLCASEDSYHPLAHHATFFFKNGKPRLHLVDYDHGTLRIWWPRGGILGGYKYENKNET